MAKSELLERFVNGCSGADRDRTGDPLLAKQVLSQLSYRPIELTALQISSFRSPTQANDLEENAGAKVPETFAPYCELFR